MKRDLPRFESILQRSRICILMLCGFLFFSISASGEDGLFEQGNRLYEQGKYAEASAVYARVTSNSPTAAAWFNLGNAQYKAGELGEAIASWKKARSISPRDAATRANLDFGRSKVVASSGSSALESRLSYFTPNEWATGAAAALAFGFIALAAMEMKRGAGPRSTGRTAGVLFVVALLLAIAAVLAHFHALRRSGVVKSRQVAVRFGPLEDSQVAFQLNEGAEVYIEEDLPRWLHVRDAAGRTGWVPQIDVVKL